MRKPLPFKVGNNVSKLLRKEQERRLLYGGEKFLMSDIEEEVGKYCGVRREAIYSIKRGKSNAGLPLAFKIAEYFNVELEDVFYLTSEEENQVEMEFEEDEEMVDFEEQEEKHLEQESFF
jgi:putative transcriptional regulator